MCGGENSDVPKRYESVASDTSNLKELKNVTMDYKIGPVQEDGELVFIFVVDVAGEDGAFLDLVKNCLMAAMESIPKGSLVGLLIVSDTVGVYDLGSESSVHVKKIVVPEDQACDRTDVVGIEEVIPISHFLIPLDEEHEEILLQAIEGLNSHASKKNDRGLGTAVRMVVDYCAVYRDLQAVRVGMFLNGRPNVGPGALSSDRLLDIEPETDFYLREALSSRATFDIFCSTNEEQTLGLAAIKFLPMKTGGLLVNGFQPQDLYRLYKHKHAYNCDIVLRTSPDIAVSEDYQKDVKILACSVRDSFSYDFEYTNSGGTYSDYILLQVAFAYTMTVGRGRLQRFLRVITSRAKSSLSWRMVYPAVVPEVQLTLLAHKVARACFDEGVVEAKEMLKQWIQKLADLCAENNVSLGVFQNMKDFPRYVFGLLQSPMLRSVISSDEFITSQVLLAKLPPREVLTYVYPQVQSWKTFDKMQSKSVHLNLAATVASQCPILLMDTYWKLIVKSETAVPKDSALKNAIDKIREVRMIGPDIVMDDKGALFESCLLEEHGYKEFLNDINSKKLKKKRKDFV